MDGWSNVPKSIIKKGKWKTLQSGENPSDTQLEIAQEEERIPVKPERASGRRKMLLLNNLECKHFSI